MNKFKILIITTILVLPLMMFAQTSLDSGVTNTDSNIVSDPNTIDSNRTTDSSTTNTTTTKIETKTDTTVSSEPDTRTLSTTDSVNSNDIETVINNSINDINEEQKNVENEIRTEINDSISNSILEIRSQEQQIEAYELQRVVDDTRNTIYEDINKTINSTSQTDSEPINQLGDRVESALYDIERSLEERSGVDVDVSKNVVSIRNTILRYEKIIEEKKALILEREGDLLDKDTDEDGLSDYDEKFIYNTDPENAFTVPGELNDTQKILAGIDPTDPEEGKIQYRDPRQDRESFISKVHTLKRVELVTKDGAVGKRMKLEGTALPNSIVTVFVFSEPIIVTIKTNNRGEWSYTLDKELENGQHEVYVSTVDNTGRLIARSEGIAVTQTDELAALGVLNAFQPAPPTQDFIKDNLILIILSVLLVALIVVLTLSGNKKDDDDFNVNKNIDDQNFGNQNTNNQNSNNQNTESENKDLNNN